MDGRAYTLPIDTVQADDGGLIVGGNWHSYPISSNEPHLGLDKQEDPFLIFAIGKDPWVNITRWTGSQWSSPYHISNSSAPIVTQPSGVMNLFNKKGSSIYRSDDNGSTWTKYSIGVSFTRPVVDMKYMWETGHLRFAAHDTDFKGRNIVTLNFDSDVPGVIPTKLTTSQSRGAFVPLLRNYPNPFRQFSTIDFQLMPTATKNEGYRIDSGILTILDLQGKVMRRQRLKNAAGTFTWDGKNAAGRSVPAGLYFYSISSGSVVQFNAMLLLK